MRRLPPKPRKEGQRTMLALWTGILGFVLGFIFAFCWQQYRWQKSEKKWSLQKKKLKRELSQAKAIARTAESKAANIQRQQKLTQNKRKPAPSAPAQQPGSHALPPDIRKTFRPVESLGLTFQYLLPDSLILQAGTGFLRNTQNELIPDENAFQGMNSAAGYAMDGSFYLYHAVYHGKEYTFQQILDGDMGIGYVRLHSVIEPAKIAQVGSAGYYSLTAAGKLLVVDT